MNERIAKDREQRAQMEVEKLMKKVDLLAEFTCCPECRGLIKRKTVARGRAEGVCSECEKTFEASKIAWVIYW